MAENLEVAKGSKEAKYELLYRQIKSLAEDETDAIALMENVASMIHYTFGFLWTGFYRVKGDVLVLGPYQGPLACSRIPYGKGVCGTAWRENKTQIVADVDSFPGHIACSSESRSEIVIPLVCGGKVVGVLDIDSRFPGCFDETDGYWLEKITDIMVSADILGNECQE